ncbi:MAG: 5-formyltetrahydrofolate cyclo-ligase [Kiritimatiellales bacterium]|nr:5-formyltetrahydrofolate cyclo-ligase [Kiritimatiellales bacterium]
MTKAEIRAHVAQAKKFQPLERLSEQVVEKLQTLELFQQAKAVGAYMPLPDEVDIRPFFQTLEKQMYIPAYDEKSGGYRMAKYTPELKKGKFGIPEPLNPVWAEADELDLILVPGVAFDRAGGRIGRGGGFYDRLLPQYSAVRAGICFDFQCLPVLSDEGVEAEEIPTEPHDCKMDLLIMESEILKFAMNS